ncbi:MULTISPECIES: hypothetical protein [Pseudomonas syringae group]|uniref:hypothetical protein n=1 Tax=Pseudomonas syringae group TaxID=136849 RepID=UPI00177A9B81|nr:MULTISPECIES: hypothetical protein [Pseudomonas syringae group]QOI07930.1 hypothetical protein D5S10_29850 [Pseudomonas savastanoi]QOQ33421.1 hypothetical protein [Pseudomonas syringae pv. actinidiae]
MAKRLTIAQMEARYEALAEASEHLRMEWTDNDLEAIEGHLMADWLQEQARKWLLRAENARELGHP